MWTLKLSPQASAFYEGLTGKHKKQMSNAFDRLAQDPYQGKPLKGELKGYWSFRVGVYRILYLIRQTEIIV
jgi:mRNA-degrading endonuclease RelE of RelBE toxin-antitoxin system